MNFKKVNFKTPLGLILPSFRPIKSFWKKVYCVGQLFWVTQMQGVNQCKECDKHISQSGKIKDNVTLKHNRHFSGQKNVVCDDLTVNERSPRGMSSMPGSSDYTI